MTGTDQDHGDAHHGWESMGRAAEEFARRVARDASRFAERIAEHASEFARDIARDRWRSRRDLRDDLRRTAHRMAGADARRVFEDIRGVVSEVLDGVDELVARVFDGAAGGERDTGERDTGWVRVVHNRD